MSDSFPDSNPLQSPVLTASMPETAMTEGLRELSDSESTATCEPETFQTSPDVAQQVESATSESASNEEDTDFTRKLANGQRREVKSEFMGDIHMYVRNLRSRKIECLPYTVCSILELKTCVPRAVCCREASTGPSTRHQSH